MIVHSVVNCSHEFGADSCPYLLASTSILQMVCLDIMCFQFFWDSTKVKLFLYMIICTRSFISLSNIASDFWLWHMHWCSRTKASTTRGIIMCLMLLLGMKLESHWSRSLRCHWRLLVVHTCIIKSFCGRNVGSLSVKV